MEKKNENYKRIIDALANRFYLKETDWGLEDTFLKEYWGDEPIPKEVVEECLENAGTLEDYIAMLKDYVIGKIEEWYSVNEYTLFVESFFDEEEIVDAFGGVGNMHDELRELIYVSTDAESIKSIIGETAMEATLTILTKGGTNEDNYEVVMNELSGKPDALTWLCNQYGYDLPLEESQCENEFLKSVYDEIYGYKNTGYNYGCLGIPTIVDAYTYGVLFFKKFNKVIIGTRCECGIIDTVCGGGSGWGIELPSPLTVPASMIGNITEGYSFSDIVGELPVLIPTLEFS